MNSRQTTGSPFAKTQLEPDMQAQIKAILQGGIVPHFPDSEVAVFSAICKPTILKPNAHFLAAGKTPKRFGFVLQGLVRYYYISEEGREYTKAFLAPGALISAYTAMKSGTPSLFSIQALTQTEIISVDYSHWKAHTLQNESWLRLQVALLEKGYAVKEKRERDLLLLDAASRYAQFREEFAALEPVIKQHHIASYLGITPIALSRIRRKMGLINPG